MKKKDETHKKKKQPATTYSELVNHITSWKLANTKIMNDTSFCSFVFSCHTPPICP